MPVLAPLRGRYDDLLGFIIEIFVGLIDKGVGPRLIIANGNYSGKLSTARPARAI